MNVSEPTAKLIRVVYSTSALCQQMLEDNSTQEYLYFTSDFVQAVISVFQIVITRFCA